MARPTMDELRAQMPRKGTKLRGLYAAPPGTGPAEKTKYTHGDATTILTRTPACKHFEEET